MTATVRRTHVAYPAANTRVRAYTVPAGKRAILKTMTFSSDNATQVLSGTTINGAGFIWQEAITDGASKTFGLSTVLDAGTFVEYESNAGATNFLLQYVELDQTREGANVFTHYFDNIGVLKTVNVPAGKRWRARELVVSPHGAGGININVYVSGVGYVLRATTVANESLVLPIDLSVNPGEQIGAQASGGTVHAWLTFVQEDA